MQQMKTSLVCCIPGSFDFHATERSYGNLTVRFAAPRTSPVLDTRQLSRCFVDEQLDRVLVTEPVPAGDRIVKVIIETVVVLDDSGRATLGSNSVAAHRIHLGD